MVQRHESTIRLTPSVTTSQPTDPEQLVALACEGDRRAFRALYDSHVRRVRSQVGRMLGPGPEVDDVVQEVFVQLHRALPTFRGDAKFSTWLYRLTWNVTASHLRRRRPVVDLESLRQLQLATEDWKRLEARDLCATLYAALDQVSEGGREAFLLYHVEGMTLQEIADLDGSSINTIAARVRRTREKLADVLARAAQVPNGGGR